MGSDNSLNVVKIKDWDLGLFFRYSPLEQLCDHCVHPWPFLTFLLLMLLLSYLFSL